MGILLVYDVTDERSFNSQFLLVLFLVWRTFNRPPYHGGKLAGLFNSLGLLSIDIRTWFSNVEQHATEGVNKILIGNKCDWEEKRVISTQRGQQLADELGIPFLEVSAKSNINVEKAFYSLAADIKKRMIDTARSDQNTSQSVNVTEPSSSGPGSLGSKCC